MNQQLQSPCPVCGNPNPYSIDCRHPAAFEPAGPKYPKAVARLVGTDGNAFAVLGRVRRALETAGVPKEERDAFFAEATAGDYSHLLATCMKWVSVR